MKKHAIFLGSLFTLSLTTMSHLQAEVSDTQVRNLENRINVLEQKKGANAMVNPSGRPQVRDGADVFFTADLLIWQAHENGLEYAIKTDGDLDLPSALYNSSTKNMEFDWDAGFRVGFGWNTPHDGWDLLTNWTWFQNKAHKDSSVRSDNLFLPTNEYAPAEAGVKGFRSADSQWKLHLNMVDIELGREFFVSKWMTLRPFIGVRSAWINQKHTETFSRAVPIEELTVTASLLKRKNNYWGLGPRSGLNTQWGLGHGFSLIGNANLSLIYGFFHLENLQKSKKVNADPITNINNAEGMRVGRAISELAMGLRWDTMFADDCCHFGIQAGWEQLMFFGQNQFKQFIGTSPENAGSFVANQGDLTIQGWTLSARIDF